MPCRAAQAVAEDAAECAAGIRANEISHGLAGRLEHIAKKLFQVTLAGNLEELRSQLHLLHLAERAFRFSGLAAALELPALEFAAFELAALEAAALEFAALEFAAFEFAALEAAALELVLSDSPNVCCSSCVRPISCMYSSSAPGMPGTARPPASI